MQWNAEGVIRKKTELEHILKKIKLLLPKQCEPKYTKYNCEE